MKIDTDKTLDSIWMMLKDETRMQWSENKVGIALVAVFVVGTVILILL